MSLLKCINCQEKIKIRYVFSRFNRNQAIKCKHCDEIMIVKKRHETIYSILFFVPIYFGIVKAWIDHDYHIIMNYPSKEISAIWFLSTMVVFINFSKYERVKSLEARPPVK